MHILKLIITCSCLAVVILSSCANKRTVNEIVCCDSEKPCFQDLRNHVVDSPKKVIYCVEKLLDKEDSSHKQLRFLRGLSLIITDDFKRAQEDFVHVSNSPAYGSYDTLSIIFVSMLDRIINYQDNPYHVKHIALEFASNIDSLDDVDFFSRYIQRTLASKKLEKVDTVWINDSIYLTNEVWSD